MNDLHHEWTRMNTNGNKPSRLEFVLVRVLSWLNRRFLCPSACLVRTNRFLRVASARDKDFRTPKHWRRTMIHRQTALVAVVLLCFGNSPSHAQGTAFNYSGELSVKDAPARGEFDFQFRLWDEAQGGTQIGPTIRFDAIRVERRRFSVTLDFGAESFDGDARWLEIGVRRSKKDESYTMLKPRQNVKPVPYAIHAGSASRLSKPMTANQLPAGVAFLQSNQTFTGSAYFNPAAGPPFQVGSRTKVPMLHADMLDGLEGADFAKAKHTHSAEEIVDGVIQDGRIGGVYRAAVEFRNPSNLFTGSFVGDGANITNMVLPVATENGLGIMRAGPGLTTTGGVVSVRFGESSGTAVEGNDARLSGNWKLGGNELTSSPGSFLGTLDRQPLEFWVNNARAIRLEPTTGAANFRVGQHALSKGVVGTSISGGRSNSVSSGANYATIPGGFGAVARSYGQQAYASGFFSEPGDAQAGLYVLRGLTTADPDPQFKELFLDGVSRRIQVPRGSVWMIDVSMIATTASGSPQYGYIRNAVVWHFGGQLRIDWGESDGRVWLEGATNGTNGELKVMVSGGGAEMRWVAVVRTTEVKY